MRGEGSAMRSAGISDNSESQKNNESIETPNARAMEGNRSDPIFPVRIHSPTA